MWAMLSLRRGLDFRAEWGFNGRYSEDSVMTIEWLWPEVKDAPAKPLPRPRRKPMWRQAEEYFQKERDGKIPVTLPRLAFMERSDG